MSEHYIEFENVTKSYGHRQRTGSRSGRRQLWD